VREKGIPIFVLIMIVVMISRFYTAYNKNSKARDAQFYAQVTKKAQATKSEPKIQKIRLKCEDCELGIPIYDSWSTERTAIYALNGEWCEVAEVYDKYNIPTLQARATHEYIDTEPHLYLRCPTEYGFVYMSHTSYCTGKYNCP